MCKLCVRKLCVSKLCVSKLCVSKLCVSKLCEQVRGGGGQEADGMQNQKQEPHTKMWGKKEVSQNCFVFNSVKSKN